jgi:putative phosphoesterase
MRIGFLSDIHGNYSALKRALELLSGADRIFCLGDSISQYGFSNSVVGLLREREIATIWGNHEAQFYGAGGERARSLNAPDPESLAWLSQRPLTLKIELLGRTLLMVHSTPKNPIGNYAAAQGGSFEREFGNVAADIIACGHTHQPFARRLGSTLVVNPGSVGEGRPEAKGFISSCASLDLAKDEWRVIDFTVPPSR